MAIRNWVKGDGITHEHLNEGVDAINNNLPITGGPGVLVRSGNGGTAVSLNSNAFNAVLRVGRIVDSGPNDEDNYTDPDGRYWVQFEANETDDDSYVEYGPLNIVDEVGQQPAEIIVTAHNVSDADAGTRTMTTGQIVHAVRISFDQPASNQLTQLRWVIISGGSSQVSITWGISIQAPNWYAGTIVNGRATNFDLDGETTGANCYVTNGPEEGSLLPPLNPTGTGTGHIIGYYVPTDEDDPLVAGTPLVRSTGFAYGLGCSDSGSGSG